jgi:acetyl esterase/lipase
VKSVLRAEGESSAPEEVGKVTERTFAGADGRKLPARVYTPKDAGTGPLPVVLYFHGGGWVVSDIDAYDASARSLANETGAIVVSAHYRQGPEHKFPAAHDDAFAAYRWVTQNAPAFGGDPRRIAVAGESAGGNLAANVAIKARDSGMRMPAHMLLVYPVASGDLESGSAKEHANAKPLSKDMMFWFAKQYFNSPADALDARIDLVNANLAGLPPTTIVNAEFDPLLSGGELLADRLEAAGVDVEQKTYEGVTHEFFGTGAVVEEAREAMDFAAGRVEASLESPTKPAPRRALPPPGASRSQGRPVGVLARTR